ncbi:MAG: hypothetical protein Q9221_008170 [Calogaya cf. arnoldii]
MRKRKSGAVQFEDDSSRKSKKPRVDSAQPALEPEDEGAQQPSNDVTEDPLVEKETKEARAARKLAKRLAKRDHRQSKDKYGKAHSKEPQKDDATPLIPPVEAEDVAAEPKEESPKGFTDPGDSPKPEGSSTPTKKERREKERARREGERKEREEKFGPDAIKIARTKRDNKIKANSIRGRGEFYQNPDEWYFSRPAGGRMRDIDPLFSTNEEYLLVAFRSSVNVYSTTTSLLLREMRPMHHQRVSDLALSPSNNDLVYISTEGGSIRLWNFVTGTEVHDQYTKCSVYGLQATKPVDSDDSSDMVYTLDRQLDSGIWRIRVHRFKVDMVIQDSELKEQKMHHQDLRQSQEPITAFRVIKQGKIIIATSGSVLTLGHANQPIERSLKNLSYTWRDVECPEWISCIDVRTVSSDRSPKKSKDSEVVRTDIVVGGLKGALHVYDDLLRQLIRMEKPSKGGPKIDLTSRKQHWHRTTAFSAKWSRDGNYIISGGLETTLLLWQLETGHINTLPHLGAPIEAIVVSPSGSSYAIRLADNSAMILSTAELKPTFSIAGIQFPESNPLEHLKLPYLPTVDSSSYENKARPRQLHPPAVNGPLGLLCAVPSLMPSRVPSAVPQPRSFLQTIDTISTQQLSRQAMTRTKATDLNVGPESNTIREPDILLIQLSQDGQWLVTVDEWVPPKRDLAAHSYNDDQATEEQDARREIYLKFWSWDEDTKVWSLVSRVDDPHASQCDLGVGKNRVLDLVADPSSSGFATVGQDGVVKTWKASARQRHNSTVRDKHGQGLVNWNCRSAIPLDSSASSSQPYTGAKLAYSSDGSCIAAALTLRSPWTIRLVDPETRKVTSAPYGPYTGSLFGLGIIDRFLIVLSDHLDVWNLVTHELSFAYTLSPQRRPDMLIKPQTKHLAVDPPRGTFAIGLPYVNPDPHEVRTNHHSQLIIFNPTDPVPLGSMITQETLAILTPLQDRPGYLLIDAAADLRTFAPGRRRTKTGMALPTPPATPTPRGLEAIYGDAKKPKDSATGTGAVDLAARRAESHVEEDDVKVVTQEKLAEVLDCGPAYAMPPVSEMFERVAKLFAGSGGA